MPSRSGGLGGAFASVGVGSAAHGVGGSGRGVRLDDNGMGVGAIEVPRRSLIIVVGVACALFAALVVQQRVMEGRAVRRALVGEGLRGPPRALADVASAARTMKLVTVEIETSVTARVRDESWRGDVTAQVTAPARLMYGTDLSRMDVSRVGFSPLEGRYVVRVPRPERLATEVFPEREAARVETGWLRFRTRAGEYVLGLARRALGEQARHMRLREEDAEQVREATREQVARLVRSIVGEQTSVGVVFDDAAGGPGAGP